MRLKDKSAIVTGSTKGIGFSVAKRFLEEGAKVVINGRDELRLKSAQKELSPIGKVCSVAGDVSDGKVAGALAEACVQSFGRIDILVNNAGITKGQRILDITEEDWDSIITVNLKGTFLCAKAALPNMMERNKGHIINLSSLYMMGSKGQLHYDATKGGIASMTRSMALELARYNIIVNCVAPGLLDTDMPKVIPERIIDDYIKSVPLRRLGTAEEAAALIAFLASDENSYMTGQVLHINGGVFRT